MPLPKMTTLWDLISFSIFSIVGLLIFAPLSSIAPHELIAGKQIFGSWGGGCNPDFDIPKLAEIYLEGQLPLNKLISKRYKLDDINTAINDLEKGLVFRPIIEMSH